MTEEQKEKMYANFKKFMKSFDDTPEISDNPEMVQLMLGVWMCASAMALGDEE